MYRVIIRVIICECDRREFFIGVRIELAARFLDIRVFFSLDYVDEEETVDRDG